MQEQKSKKASLILTLSFVLALFVGVLAAYASICFGPSTEFPVVLNPLGITSADFDKDGNIDLAVANSGFNSSGNVVSILLGTGVGTFRAARNINLIGLSPCSVNSADLNNDGNIDLGVSVFQDGSIQVLLGNGDGTFSRPTRFVVGPFDSGPTGVAIADFNEDGNLDIATAVLLENNISVLLGDGTGDFGSPTRFSAGQRPAGPSVGDFNNDGHVDLVAANDIENKVSVLLGDGTGNFGPPASFDTDSRPVRVAVADFNNNGDLDLAVPNGASRNVSVLLGDGTGFFEPMLSFAAGDGPNGITTADFNNDGNFDLVVTNFSDCNISVLEGTGLGTFEPQVTFPINADGPRQLTNADFNNDGLLDVACPNEISNNVSVLLQVLQQVYCDNS